MNGVYRFLLTPRWLALHFAVIVALLGCLLLGWWQFGVYQDSTDRQQIRERDPAPVTELVRPGEELGEARDRQAVTTGDYLAEAQRLVPGRVHEGVLGYLVVTPLRVSDTLVVPVLRGWIADSDDPAAAVPEGEVTVTGFLLPPESADQATVRSDQQLADDEVAYVSPAQLAESADIAAATLPGGYLLLQDEQASASPAAPAVLDVDVVEPIHDISPWQNLSYWAQWWVFALAAMVFWVSAVRSGVRARRRDVSERARAHVPS